MQLDEAFGGTEYTLVFQESLQMATCFNLPKTRGLLVCETSKVKTKRVPGKAPGMVAHASYSRMDALPLSQASGKTSLPSCVNYQTSLNPTFVNCLLISRGYFKHEVRTRK